MLSFLASSITAFYLKLLYLLSSILNILNLITRNTHTVLRITIHMTFFVCWQEIVQRLFDDQEDEQSTDVTDKDAETRAEQLPVQVTTVGSSTLTAIQRSILN